MDHGLKPATTQYATDYGPSTMTFNQNFLIV